MKTNTNMILDGRGFPIGFISEEGDDRVAHDKRGMTVGRYQKSNGWTVDTRTGKVIGNGDQTMRLLK